MLASTLVVSAAKPVAAHAGDDCALFAPADVAENDWFGSSVGIDGDTAVITSWIAEEDGGPLNAGAAYVYDRQPDGSWVEGQKLLPSNPGVDFNFGFSADIDGDIIAIGAWNEDVNGNAQAGAAYVFERPSPTGTWVETARLVASDADAFDDFGNNLEVDAATQSVIIGAPKEDEGGPDAGAAYVFRKDNGSWAQEAKLLDPNANTSDRAGNDVAISGDWAVVGHHTDDQAFGVGKGNVGGALVYNRTGSTWGAPIELDGSDPQNRNRAGYGVDVDGDLLVMTSYDELITDRSTAWIFRENNGVWTEEQRIEPYPARASGEHPDAGNSTAGTHFGRHVELNNGVIAIGASYDADLDFEQGATHYFTQDTNGLWAETAKIDPEGNAKFFHAGIAVALSDTHAVIGAEKGNKNDDGIHESEQTSPDEIFNSGLACIGELSNILDGTHSPNPFYGVYASVGDASVMEGADGEAPQVTVDVTLSQAASDPVTLDVSTEDGTATTANSDYTPIVGQTVTFAPGSTTETVTIDVTGDYTVESDETFSVILSNPITGVLIEDDTGQVTVENDDVVPAVTVGDASIPEGDSGTTQVQVDLSLPFPAPETLTATVATQDITATEADNDFVAFSGTVTFNPGDQTQPVLIDIVGDEFIEGNETFELRITGTSSGLVIAGDGSGEIVIEGDDENAVSVGDATITEGPEGANPTISVDVTLTEPAATPVDVTISTADGTATLSDGDYQPKSEVVTFNTGESQKSVTFTVNGDGLAEIDEVFFAVASDPGGGVMIADGVGDITITNDDPIVVTVGDATVIEGADGVTATVTVDVTLSSPATSAVSLTVDTADGTATTAGSDYVAVAGQAVSFATGETSKQVSIDVIGDDVAEPDEAFTLVGSGLSAGLTAGNLTGTIDVLDDDSVRIVVGDASVTEGADGATDTVDVTVSLTQPATGPVDVTIATADDTATAGVDYVTGSEVVSFLATESSKTVTFTVNGDDTPEGNETFLVQASGAAGASIADGTGEVTIIDDDSIAVSIGDGATDEGDVGSVPVLLDVTLSAPAVEAVTVEVSTVDGTATTADNDYEPVTSQVVTFGVGQSSKQVSVAVNGDERFEADETFTVNLANPSAGLSVAVGSGTVTINDDEQIMVSVGDATVQEGDTPTTTTVSVDVTLSDPAVVLSTVAIDTLDGTATTADSDYQAPGQQTLTFQPGDQVKTVDVVINGDDGAEPDETFSVVASAPTGDLGLADATGVVTIENDDPIEPVTVTIGDATVPAEGDDGTTPVDVTISLSQPAVTPITLDVSTVAAEAVSPDDYQPITDQQVAFAVGESSKTVSINIVGDTLSEPSETFTLVGSNLIGAGASFQSDDNVGEISITDDDPVTVSISDVSVIETDTGANNVLITFALSGENFDSVVVDYTTVDGTATLADVDYVERFGEVRFLPGTTVLTRGFQYIGDTNAEDDEFFEVVLSNPINAGIGQGTARITILDDDTPKPNVIVSDVTLAAEGDVGTSAVSVTVSLDEPALEPGTATLITGAPTDTATADDDYVARSAGDPITVSFAVGEQSKTVDLTVNGDVVPEANEFFTLFASSADGGVRINPEPADETVDHIGVVTITDDDAAITVTVGDVVATEGDSGVTTADVAVTLSNPAPGPMTIDLATADGTAVAAAPDLDYIASPNQTISFGAGETSKAFSVQINGDETDEPDEVFTIVASNPTGGLLIQDGIGEVTISDDDPVEVSVTGISISEGDAGLKNAIITFSLSNPSSSSVKVDFTTADGTATVADSDYQARSGPVQFAPGDVTKTRGIKIVGDLNEEFNEVLTVQLSNAINAAIGTGSADITILNDDGVDNELSVSDATVAEGDAGVVTAEVTVSLLDPAEEPFTVEVVTNNGSATSEDLDFTPIVGQTLSFAAGEQSKVVSVDVLGDTTAEPDEAFLVVVSNSSIPGILFPDNTGAITIQNDDLIGVSVSDVSVVEGAAGATATATVDVSLASPAVGTMTVDATTVDGSATAADSDFVASTQTVTFASGEQTKSIDFTVSGDDRFEQEESFTVALVSPGQGLSVTGDGTVTITNDDPEPADLSVLVGGATVLEGDAGSTIDAIVDVTLTAPALGTVTVDLASVDGSATTAGGDYAAFNQTVTFLENEQVKQVAVTINGDDADEPDESFTIVASNPSAGLLLADDTGDITILDDDETPLATLIVSDTSVEEGDAGTTTATVTLTLDQAPLFPVSVDVSTSDGTATSADGDYIPIAGQRVDFAAGEQNKTVEVAVVGDTNKEQDETFTVIASNPIGAVTVGDGIGEITIVTDDAIEISVGDVVLTEGNTSFKNAQVVFTLSAAPETVADAVIVQFTTQDGTATAADGDYLVRSGQLRFGPGVTTLTRGFRVLGDTTAEANETFTIELSAPENATIADGSGEVTILDNDTTTIALTVGDLAVDEGDAGTAVASVTLALESPAVDPLTVEVSTVNGTATAGEDYTAVATELVTFAAGDQSQTVEIPINGDTDIESDEQFTLVATNPSNGLELIKDTGTITIVNDDQPQLSISDVTVTEGDIGTVNAAVTVSLDRLPEEPLTAVISTQDGSATIADSDYVAIGETLTFQANEQSKVINIAVNGDSKFEIDEQFLVVATTPSAGLVLADDTGVVTIINDDGQGALSVIVGDATIVEGGPGTTAVATVAVTLSAAFPAELDVDVATADGTATSIDSDYVAMPAQTLTFAANEVTKQFQITINGDDVEEADENFSVVASNPSPGLTIGNPGGGTVTILNDDITGLEVSVGDVSEIEGEAGTKTVSVPVTLNDPAPVLVDVEINTVDATATAADGDYVALAGQTVTFAPGEQNKTIDVVINGDTDKELDESFNVVASNPSAPLGLGDDTGVVTIVTDDAVSISAGDVTITEIDAGYKWAQMTFTLSAAPGSDTFVVQYATEDGTATQASGDYEAKSGELRFANSRTTLTRGFKVFGDVTPELNEQFNVILSAPVNGIIADGTGTVFVTDDDFVGNGLAVGDVEVTEGDAGSTTASVPLTLALPASVPLTVDVLTVDGTATQADSDYVFLQQAVSFAVGEQSQTVDVVVTGDTSAEANEVLTVMASNPSEGLSLVDDTGQITILNDDVPPGAVNLTVGDIQVAEGESGSTTASVTLTLSGLPAQEVTVDVATADGTATTADSDYVPIAGQTVTFNTTEQTKTVDITVNGDTDREPDETFTLLASNPSFGLLLGDPEGTVTIETDDAITVSASDVTLTEIDAGYKWAQMTFTLSAAPGADTFVVDYVTADGSATLADGDYEAKTGELRFANSRTTLTRGFKVFGDVNPELDESFSVLLSNPVNGEIADGVGEVFVLDDDSTDVGLSVGDVAVTEGDSGTTSVLVDLALASAASVPMTVDVATADGDATTADGDYSPVSESVSFAIGDTVKQVSIDINGDTTIEPDETFTLVASNPSAGLLLADDTGEITINGDDAPPTLDVNLTDDSVAEGDAGSTGQASVLISLSAPAIIPVSLDVSTVDGSATAADSDFTAVTAQTISFAAGEQSKTVAVDIIGDDDFESDETFDVTVSNPSPSLNIVDGTANVTITNDDATPTLSVIVSDLTVVEGDNGSADAAVDVSLSAPAINTVTVNVETFDGTATEPSGDYDTVVQTVTFDPGDTTKQVLIPISGDTDLELDETFTLVASSPSAGLEILDGSGVITIQNDEILTVDVDDQIIAEGDDPGTGQVSVGLSLSEPAVAQVTVLVDTVDGTATTADGDYVAVSSQLVTFPIGSSSQTVLVTVNGDDAIEPDETFSVVASAPSAGLTLGDPAGLVTIQTDDQAAVSIADVTLTEINAGYRWAQVKFSLAEASTQTVQIEFTTVDGSATAADGDYVTRTEIVSFAPGTTEKFRGIQILGDTEVEGDEFLTVELVGPPVNAVVADGIGRIDILDNND